MFDSDSLWRRDPFALLRLTGPVAAARLGVMAMGLTDALVVGRYSAGVSQLDLALPWRMVVQTSPKFTDVIVGARLGRSSERLR